MVAGNGMAVYKKGPELRVPQPDVLTWPPLCYFQLVPGTGFLHL